MFAALAVGAAWSVTAKHGLLVGIVAGMSYGHLAVISAIPSTKVVQWSQRHPYLDILLFPFLVFTGLVWFTGIPILVCIGMAVIGYALMLGLRAVVTRFRNKRTTITEQ